MREIDSALSEVQDRDDVAEASLRGQRAYLLFRLGRYEDGLVESECAVEVLKRESSLRLQTVEARVLSNRAIAHVYRGFYELAVADLDRALELHRCAGAELYAAQVLHNLGFVATRRGDVPRALKYFDEALVAYLRLGMPLRDLLVDRGELLTTARLIPEARSAAAEAVELLDRAGLTADVAEARLSLAEACLADRDLPAAVAAAREAELAFSRQARPAWGVLACEVREQARRLGLDGELGPLEEAQSACRSFVALERAGWHARALAVRVTAARAALLAGRSDIALSALDGIPPTSQDASPPELVLRTHARTLRHLAAGFPDEALITLRDGLEVALEHVRDIRDVTGQLGHGSLFAAMADTAVGIALDDGTPELVLEWGELGRLAHKPLPAALAGPPLVEDLLAGLGDTLLIEFVCHEGALAAVVASAGSVRLRQLGTLQSVERARSSLHFAISELSAERQTREVRRTMTDLFLRSRRELDEIVAPLLELASDSGPQPLVIVPVGVLHDMPWGMLPCLSAFAVTVASSATAWQQANIRRGARTTLPGEVLLVAGPELGAAGREIEQLHSQCYPDRQVVRLAGPAATRSAVLAGLARAEIVHLAAHGSFRADNPYMSSFRLFDGDLTVHEMAAMSPQPRPGCVVLSACEAGRIVVHPGEELAGPVPALLGFGSGHVIAAVAALVDQAMPSISLALHKRLAAGRSPSFALYEARRDEGEASILEWSELVEGGDGVDAALSLGCLVCHIGGGPLPGAPPVMLRESWPW